jgi:hypothetical protein
LNVARDAETKSQSRNVNITATAFRSPDFFGNVPPAFACAPVVAENWAIAIAKYVRLKTAQTSIGGRKNPSKIHDSNFFCPGPKIAGSFVVQSAS